MLAARVLRQRAFATSASLLQCVPREQVFRSLQGQSRAGLRWGSQKSGPRWRTFENSKSGGNGQSRRRPQFDSQNNLRRLWLTSPVFRYGTGAVGVGGGVFYVSNLETVPVSGRRRFNIYSPESEVAKSNGFYEQLLRQYEGQLLPPWHPSSKLVQEVLDRLIPHSGLPTSGWKIHVIDEPGEKNAFVIPGGKVFVFSGLLPICNGEDGLATVLGHEIAHSVAHHIAERMSSMILADIGVWGFSLLFSLDPSWTNAIFQFGYTLPGSRKHELEADYIGLLMMAESCYNPEKGVELWKRMQQESGNGPLQFLSTHPSNHNRIGKLQEWLPEARTKRETSDCGGMLGYVDDFKNVVQGKGAWGDIW